MKKRYERKSYAHKHPRAPLDQISPDKLARYNKAMEEIFGPDVEFVSVFALHMRAPIVWTYSTLPNEGQVELLKRALESYENKKDWVIDGAVDQDGMPVNLIKGGKA